MCFKVGYTKSVYTWRFYAVYLQWDKQTFTSNLPIEKHVNNAENLIDIDLVLFQNENVRLSSLY